MACEAPQNPSKLTIFITLAVILSVAGLLRIIHIDWGLPTADVNADSLNEDEWRMMDSALTIDLMKGQLKPGQLIYATANIYLYSVALTVLDGLGIIEYRHEYRYYLSNANQFRQLYLVGRIMSMAYSLAAIYLLYLLGKKIFGSRTGLCAAGLFAVIPAHVIEAHYFKNNVPLTFWFIVLGFCALSLNRQPTMTDHIWAGLALGSAAATQYNGAIFIIPLLWARFSRIKKNRRVWLLLIDKRMLALYTAALAIFLLLSPYALLMKEEAGRGVEDIFKAINRDRFYTYPNPDLSYYCFHLFPFSLSEPVFWVGIGAMPLMLLRKRDRLVVITTLVLLSLVAMSNLKVMRYVLFSSPYVCLCCARILTTRVRSRFATSLQSLVLAISLAAPGLLSVVVLDLMGRKDPRICAQEWLMVHLAPSSSIMTLHTFRGMYPPVTDNTMGVFEVTEDAVRDQALIRSCRLPVVAADLELFGIHEKYREQAARYAEHNKIIAPLFDPVCYQAPLEFNNQPIAFSSRFSSRWQPLDLWNVNPRILLFLPGSYSLHGV